MTGSQYCTRSTRGIYEAFFNADNIDERTRACVPIIQWDGYYDALVWMNDAYNKRWIDPDFIADTDTSYKLLNNHIVTSRCGYWTHDSWYGVAKDGVFEQLYKENPNAEIVAFQLDNVHGKQMTWTYAPTGMCIYVPATSTKEQAIAAVKYLNFLADYNTHVTLTYGFEGEHYEIVDGAPQYIDLDYQASDMISTNDLAIMFNGDFTYGEKMIVLACPESTRELRATLLKIALVGGYVDYSFDRPILSVGEHGGNLSSKGGELLAECIMCKPELLKTTFETKVNEYMNSGGTEVMDEKFAAYDDMNK
jgi:putative aldouronate transport system substrate-binding protein